DVPVVAVLGEALPRDHEVSVGVGGHGRLALVKGGGGVDAELRALCHPGGVVALGIDAVARAVLVRVLPRHDEVSVGVAGHAGRWRRFRYKETTRSAGSAGAEVPALRRPCGVVPLGINSAGPTAAVLPRHHEIAVGVGRYGRLELR